MLYPEQRILLEMQDDLPFASYFSVICGNAESHLVVHRWSACDYSMVASGHKHHRTFCSVSKLREIVCQIQQKLRLVLEEVI